MVDHCTWQITTQKSGKQKIEDTTITDHEPQNIHEHHITTQQHAQTTNDAYGGIYKQNWSRAKSFPKSVGASKIELTKHAHR